MIIGIHHIAIGVPDFEAGLAFYRDVMGFEVLFRSDFDGTHEAANTIVGIDNLKAEVAMLQTPNIRIELWHYNNPAPRDRTSEPADLGYPHMALEVKDIDAEYERLSAAGMTFVGPPYTLGDARAIYGRDPFGNIIELYEVLG